MRGRTIPLKHVAPEVRTTVDPDVLGDVEVDHFSIPALDESGGPLRQPAAEIQSQKQLLRGGEVLVSRLNPRKARVLEVPSLGSMVALASGEFVVLKPSRVDSRFLCYLLLSEATRQHLDGAVQSVTRSHQRIRPEQLLTLKVAMPDHAAQRAIADFLDTETARIDALITKKRRLIELLEERFSTYLREQLSAVVPKLPLKRRWHVIDCKHRTPEYVTDGYPVVSPGDVIPGRLDLQRAHRFVGQADFNDLADATRRPKRQDIIYSRNASIGIAAFVDTDEGFCMGQDVCLITSNDQSQLYLSYVLNTVGLDQLERGKIGSTFSRVNVSQILELQIPTPEPSLQAVLAEDFDVRQRAVDGLTDRLHRQITLLQEHRQALITAAVTGDIDIPGVAA